jgi:hypothetical protein
MTQLLGAYVSNITTNILEETRSGSRERRVPGCYLPCDIRVYLLSEMSIVEATFSTSCTSWSL